MPLRTRLILSVILALVVGMALGGVITIWQARQSVSGEIGSALVVGRQMAIATIDEISPAIDPKLDLQRLIGAFNGNRHIRASLIDATETPVMSSTLAQPRYQPPGWFVSVIGVAPAKDDIQLPPSISSIRAVRLETDPRNEVLEVWNSLKNTMFVIAIIGVFVGSLLWSSFTRALRPLATLASALRSVGDGELSSRLTVDGSPETKTIAAAFNHMAEDLSATRERNLDLYRQLLTLQEEDRAEIARDLHDEIGPLLFAINIDTVGIENQLDAGEVRGILKAVLAIRETVHDAQTQIRAIVNRLRPAGLAEFGLAGAIENLIDFWRRRHPTVQFMLKIPEQSREFGDLIDITAFRVVQESLNNALRHGQPTQVTISFRIENAPKEELTLEITDNGRAVDVLEPGFGLIGMRERVQAAGGRLVIRSEPGQGVKVTATLPLAQQAFDVASEREVESLS